MINIDYGITFLEGPDGCLFTEGTEMRLYLVTEFSKELNSIRHNFAAAPGPKEAWEGVVQKTKTIEKSDYVVIACASLYELLEDVLKVIPDEEHKD